MKNRQGDLKREEILLIIQHYQSKHGFCPTMREIGEKAKISAGVVKYHLDKLETAGKISRPQVGARKMARSIVLEATTKADE